MQQEVHPHHHHYAHGVQGDHVHHYADLLDGVASFQRGAYRCGCDETACPGA